MHTRGRTVMTAVKSESAASDSALAGAPAARRLYREIASAPTVSRRTVVVGPGGSGKSVLLGVLGELYRAAGVTVRRGVPGPDEPFEPNVALLLDDAHELDEAALERVRGWAAEPESQILLAHRPWPRGGPLASIVVAFGTGRGPVVLGPLDRPGVAARANLLLGERPTAELVDLVFEQTGGSPDLVDRLLVGLRDDRALDRLGSAGEPPAAVVRQLGYEIDAQPVGVRELLLGRTVGAPLDPEVLGALLDVSPGAVGELLDRAAATGLMTPDGGVVPLVRHALQRVVPAANRLVVQRRLAEIQLAAGGSVLIAARGLIGSGATGTRVAAAFERAGDEALRECLPVAADLYEAAVEAGAAPLALAARRAEAALFAGDLDAALRRADQVLAEPAAAPAAADGEAARRAVSVAAAVLAHRGMLSHSAELYRWLAGQPFGGPTLLAVPALVGIGALDEAREVMDAAGARSPTVLAGAEALLAHGIHDTVAGPPTAALSQLTRAAVLLESSGRAALLPDTPAALAALVAIHSGELDVAQSVLGQAVAAELGGRVVAARHLLLQALVAMHRGSSAQARALLQSASNAGRLEPRDELLAAALEVGLARRAGDLAGLLAGWRRAREAIVRHPVDLYSLQPLGELVVGAARLNEQGWVRPYLDEAEALLHRLGNPPLWAVALHWAGLQAAIGSDAGAVAQRHAAALDAMAPTSRYATAVAVAGREWLRSLTGDIDADAVEAAARGLHAAGLSWEGGRLASQAAIRCRDRKSMNALLGCARALQGAAEPVPSSAPADAGRAQPVRRVKVPEQQATDSAAGSISGREREVAELVLSGLTYKQIGEQLFISAKTVENHVARMRQRLGSGSRGELFAHLRMLVGEGK